MTTQAPTAPAPITSFPGYGGFFPSFPFGNLNAQFAGSMQPFGGGYGGWGMPGYGNGMGGGWPSLFGPGYVAPGYSGGYGMGGYGMGGYGMGGYGMGGGFPFGMPTYTGGAPQGQQGAPGGQSTAPVPPAAAPAPPAPPTAPASGGTPQGTMAPGTLAPPASYSTYSNYPDVGSPAWDQASGIAPGAANASIASSPWNSTQLAQADAVSPGLAQFMYQHDPGLGGGQFLQAAGFTNAPGSQQMLNQAGQNWMFANNPTYGGARNAAGQRMQFGMTPSGVPFSYAVHGGLIANNPAFQQWAQTGQGAVPAGVTLYNQFAPQRPPGG